MPMVDGHPPAPPVEGRALMTQRWEHVTFVHWDFDPEDVQKLLPPGLEVDTHADRAWVGLVPFAMRRIGPVGLGAIPYLGSFPETNVRTYVRAPDGSTGVWFHSLEAARLLPVIAARVGYQLPYFFAAMRLRVTDQEIAYNSIRRWPGPRGVGDRVHVRIGQAKRDAGALDEFLTSRWRLFTYKKNRIRVAEVRHEPWPLHHAELVAGGAELVTTAGYPEPETPPHVLYSPRVNVTAYSPRTIRL